MTDKQAAGRRAEDAALARLRQSGLTLLARNYRARRGEIDLVMRDGDTIVFVEVRYRSGTGYGGAAESVDYRKRAKLIAAAQSYLQQNRWRHACRFDVVALQGARLDWLRDAFRCD